MALSAFDLHSIGVGPSPPHAVGPMRAAKTFVAGMRSDGARDDVRPVQAELFGSIGATGHGHGSDRVPDRPLCDRSTTLVDIVAGQRSRSRANV